MTEHRFGDWLTTASGAKFYPLDPREDEISINDIAHALSNLCRYNGHSRFFYSVAQHSVLVSRALPRPLQFWGLMHDAAEAYLVDVPRPIKHELDGYAEIEGLVMGTIARRYGLSLPMPRDVKRVDTAILADEARVLIPGGGADWNLPEAALGIEIEPWSPAEAKQAFLERFMELRSMV